MLDEHMNLRFYRVLVLLLVVLPFLGVLIATVLLWNRYVFLSDIALLLAMTLLTGMGVTIGYHRMLTHQGFEAPQWLRGLFLILGCMSFESVPVSWAANHIKHHAHSDQEGDPHSPLEGFWHAHMGWFFSPESFADKEKYAPHLLRDPVVCFVDRNANLWMALSLLIPFVLGGWTGFLWGGLVRIFLTTHVTWSVNSICHCFGGRPFETTDESRNNWVIGLLAFGEGWHNNHHAFPRNAFHGLRWWQFDLSGLLLRILETLGLIWNVQRVSEEALEAKLRKAAGMRAALAEFREQLSSSIAGAKEDLTGFAARVMDAAKNTPQQHTLHLRQQLDALKHQYTGKLEALQMEITRRKHVRQQKREMYRQEIQALVASAKDRMYCEAKKMAPSLIL